MSQYIVDCQIRGGWDECDAQWHHAAVYIGGYELCEATVNRVKVSSLYDHYVTTHLMRVRRDPRFDTDERWRIAVRQP